MIPNISFQLRNNEIKSERKPTLDFSQYCENKATACVCLYNSTCASGIMNISLKREIKEPR